jgi:hypothetical protein
MPAPWHFRIILQTEVVQIESDNLQLDEAVNFFKIPQRKGLTSAAIHVRVSLTMKVAIPYWLARGLSARAPTPLA